MNGHMKTREHARAMAERDAEESRERSRARQQEALQQSFVQLQSHPITSETRGQRGRMSVHERMMWEEFDLQGVQLPFTAGDNPDAERDAARDTLSRDCHNLILSDPAEAARQLGFASERLNGVDEGEDSPDNNEEDVAFADLLSESCKLLKCVVSTVMLSGSDCIPLHR